MHAGKQEILNVEENLVKEEEPAETKVEGKVSSPAQEKQSDALNNAEEEEVFYYYLF